MNKFKLEMFTPVKQFFSGEVESLTCKSLNGELGVLKGHQPMTVALAPGEIKLKIDGVWKSAFNSEGFMEVRPDEVLIFSHSCEWPEDIDEARAQRRIEKDNERLRNTESLREHRHTEVELQRMMAMLQVKHKSKNI